MKREHRAYELGRAAWPDVDVPQPDFERRLDAVAARGARVACAADLYLAMGCLRRDPTAVRKLDQLVAAELPRALSRLHQPPAFSDEVRQQLMERLLVGANPRLATYDGRGPLRPWLRAAASRMGIDLVRTHKPSEPVDEDAPASRSSADPEVAHLRRRYAGPLKKAVEGALRALPIDQRNALRFYFLEGMTVEQIASVRGIHKSNVSRLISRVRREVLERVQASLDQELGLGQAELESVLRLLDGQLNLSLERALGDA